MKNKRILFMGTPDFAEESLRKLIEEGFFVIGAVTQPDKPKGRGHRMVFPPVKELALANNIPVYQPEKLKNGEFLGVLEELKPEIIVVVAYGKILPDYILNYPEFGCINVHGSLLPKYRGAAPIQWAVLDGEKITGVTTMMMDSGIDTGDILLKEQTEIREYETSEQLFDRLAKMGGELLVKTIESLPNLKPQKQDDSICSYAPMISKEMAKIDFSKSAQEVIHHICGMNSWPMAYAFYNGETVKIISAVICDDKETMPGEIIGLFKGKGLKVSCGEKCIFVKEVQFPGKKRMNIEDYLRGNSMDSDKFFA